MTYEQFLDEHRAKALQVIKEERLRYKEAQRLFDNYQVWMAKLQLQPLTWDAIGARLIELQIAERSLDDDFADTELNRSRYQRAERSPFPSQDGKTP